jgi:hypothetical protein
MVELEGNGAYNEERAQKKMKRKDNGIQEGGWTLSVQRPQPVCHNQGFERQG